MSDLAQRPNRMPPEVRDLWTQLHNEAQTNYETLTEQSAARLTPRIILFASVVVILLVGGLAFAGWRGGLFNVPQQACDAVGGLCTPTPTPTSTLTPTPTSPPTITPTPTNTPTPTLSPTPTPVYKILLAGCTREDFDFAVAQVSPVEQSVWRSTTGAVEGLETRFTLTNTGACRLVEGSVWTGDVNNINSMQEVAKLPSTLNQEESVTRAYEWPALEEGHHTITLTLQFKTEEGTLTNLTGREFVLEIDLNVILDRDDDRVSDAQDSCPDEKGPPELGGCPDSDGDGIVDGNDCCPEVPGGLSGCPDGDGDGFPERNDGGCPALPPVDLCPDECGTNPEEPGCPVCYEESKTCKRCLYEREGECVEYEEYECGETVCEPCP